MEYRTETKYPFSLIGFSTMQNPTDSYQTIPQLWQSLMEQDNRQVFGTYGVCIDHGEGQFEYMIADLYDPENNPISHSKMISIPRQLFAIFPCRGPLPESLQNVNTQIWQEWLPSNGKYVLDGSYNIEAYFETEDGQEDYSEIWVPVKTIS